MSEPRNVGEPTAAERAAVEAYTATNPAFRRWADEQAQPDGAAAGGAPPAAVEPAARGTGADGGIDHNIEADDIDADGPVARGWASGGIDYLHGYGSSDFNKCGQAAVATLLDFHGVDPFGLPRTTIDPWDGRPHWDDETVIAAVARDFPPDMFFGMFGTGAGRIRDALRHYGLRAAVGHAGLLAARDRGPMWQHLRDRVAGHLPTPVLVDTGRIGGSTGAHWPVVYRIAGGFVYLASWSIMPVLPEDVFLDAWHCWFLPYPHRYCFVTCQR